MTSTVVMPPVVLFDVDGTLIDSGGAGARSWRHAFDKLYGIPADIGSHTAAGETDPAVARKTFEAAVGREPTEPELARLFAVYLLMRSEEVRTSEGYRVLEGVEDLLLMLSDAGTMLGLVSGAMEGAARVKLSPADLNRFVRGLRIGLERSGDAHPGGHRQGRDAPWARRHAGSGVRGGRHAAGRRSHTGRGCRLGGRGQREVLGRGIAFVRRGVRAPLAGRPVPRDARVKEKEATT
jgi:Haloacid dehalogenase-like hydrolase